jgi:hypothetical protein
VQSGQRHSREHHGIKPFLLQFILKPTLLYFVFKSNEILEVLKVLSDKQQGIGFPIRYIQRKALLTEDETF